jgi:hypothetical protein
MIIQLCIMGQQGYVANQHNHNMYNVLEDGILATDNNGFVATITQQTAANVTPGSTLGNTYAALLPMANPSPSPNKYAAAAAAINPTFCQSNADVVAHAKLVIAQQCPAHACCKSSSCVQLTPHSGGISAALTTSTCLCTPHPSIEQSCPISQQQFQSGPWWAW